jgi:SWI/SNF-related matrix-associated actin-dependent regulator 1 of chromatin subfamily A
LVSGDEALKAQVRDKIANDYAEATAAVAATAKAVAEAYAAAQAATLAAAKAKTLADKQAADALRVRALVAVRALYLQVLGREGDTAGLDYFADRFGDVIDPDELQIFKDMSKDEIDARNEYLADMAKKSKEDAAKAKVIADGFAATAAKARAEAAAANKSVFTTTTGGGGVNPMLILAAAAAAFFIGG